MKHVQAAYGSLKQAATNHIKCPKGFRQSNNKYDGNTKQEHNTSLSSKVFIRTHTHILLYIMWYHSGKATTNMMGTHKARAQNTSLSSKVFIRAHTHILLYIMWYHREKDGRIYVKNLPYGCSVNSIYEFLNNLGLPRPGFVHPLRGQRQKGQEHQSCYVHFKYRRPSQLVCWMMQIQGRVFPPSTKPLECEILLDTFIGPYAKAPTESGSSLGPGTPTQSLVTI